MPMQRLPMHQSDRSAFRKILGNSAPFILLALLIIFVLRMVFIGLMGLMPQDAYYYFYGQNLALSYFDHPPAIAYLLRFFTDIFGRKVYVIKLADSITTLLSLFSFYHLCKFFLSTEKVLIACILLFSTFMITTLSLVSTPDVPLLLFWTLSLFTLYKAIFQKKKIYWILSGLLMGCAFDSKYTGIFLPAGLIFFLIISKEYKKLLLSAWFWLSLMLFALTIFPVVYWNWQHG
ncbi:MAG: glycosyltransferase family 39 protein, partial [Chitinophagaceae bacterium]